MHKSNSAATPARVEEEFIRRGLAPAYTTGIGVEGEAEVGRANESS